MLLWSVILSLFPFFATFEIGDDEDSTLSTLLKKEIEYYVKTGCSVSFSTVVGHLDCGDST